MSENRDYISRTDELGNIHIAEEVLAAVAGSAAAEVAGVSGLSANFGSDIAELLGKKNQGKGVHIRVEEDKISVDVAVLMAYGHTIPEVGKAVQENVKNTMESITGLEIAAVNVSVAGVVFPPKQS